jgi:hypothetical protein
MTRASTVSIYGCRVKRKEVDEVDYGIMVYS